MKKIVLMLLVGLFTCSNLYAFTDEIGASIEEVWTATEQVLGPVGIYKSKPEKGEITSNWIYDEVKRSRGLLRGIIKRQVKRRYRFDISIKKGEIATELAIKIRVQEKSRSTSPSIPWNSLRLESDDYILEREYFHKILERIGLNKAAAPSDTAAERVINY